MFIKDIFYFLKQRFIRFFKQYFTIDGTYSSILPDSIYIKKLYKKKVGKELNLKNPKGFTEKLNWLKLYDRKQIYTTLVDKFAVREYVNERIGEDYLIGLIGCWDSPEEIPVEDLPMQFVLKCNHDNGVIICKDKSKFDFYAAKKELQYHLSRNYYKKEREWPYKNVKRKIIAEAYISDGNKSSLDDYKFFCFDGKVKALFIATDRGSETKFDFFDREFNHLPIRNGHPVSEKEIVKPENFDEMIIIAEKLSAGFSHVRVDLYNINGQILFGEMTLHHYGGFHPLEPEEWEERFGDWLKLPKKHRK